MHCITIVVAAGGWFRSMSDPNPVFVPLSFSVLLARRASFFSLAAPGRRKAYHYHLIFFYTKM